MKKEKNNKSLLGKATSFLSDNTLRIKTGIMALAMLISSGCAPADKHNDKDEENKPGTEMFDDTHEHDHEHDYDHDYEFVEEPKVVENVKIEIKPGVVVEVDGSLFPNVEDLNNDEILAILAAIEKENKENGKEPLVDPSLLEGLEDDEPVKPPVTVKPDKNHKHSFGEWMDYNDDVEIAYCDCGESITREHKYTHLKTSYAADREGEHFVVDTEVCLNCGHKITTAHKEKCGLKFKNFDDKYEYRECEDCEYVLKTEHQMELVSVDKDENATFACQNEGCSYTRVIEKPKDPVVPGIPGFIDDIKDEDGTPIFHTHSFTEWKSVGDKLELRKCIGCGKTETRPHEYNTHSSRYESVGDRGHVKYTTDTCKNCGHEKITKSDIIGHNLVSKVNDDGSTTYTCSQAGCNYTKTVQNTEHTTHNWVEIGRSIGTPAGEDKHNTTITYECSIGGELRTVNSIDDCKFSETITPHSDAKGHWSTTTGTCACGNSYSKNSEVIPHKFGEWSYFSDTQERSQCGVGQEYQYRSHSFTVIDTCTTKEEKCSTCGYSKGAITKPNPTHKWGKWISINNDTQEQRTCSICKTTETRDKAHTHVWSDWSYLNDSSEQRTCSKCGKTETRGHNYFITDTCTTTEEKCSTCGHSKGVTIKPTPTHKWGSWVANETDTQETRTCSVCGKTETRDKTHTHVWSDWSYLNDSSEQRTCSKCGKTETRGHSYSKIETCTTTEEKCSTCGHSKGVVTKPTPTHKWGNWISINNDTQEQRTCSACGAKETRDKVKPHVHNWKITGSETKPIDGSTHGTVITYSCSCGETKSETKDATSCTISGSSHVVESGSDSSKHWTVSEGKCSCGNTITVRNEASHSYTIPGTTTSISDTEHSTTYTCECGAIDPLSHTAPHSFSTSTSTQGCITTTTQTCSCGKTITSTTENHVEVYSPEQSDRKWDVYVCANCGVRLRSVEKKHEHDYSIPGTTTSISDTEHSTIYSCECGATETRNEAHSWSTSTDTQGCITTTTQSCSCGKTITSTTENHVEVYSPEQSDRRWDVYVCANCGVRLRSVPKSNNPTVTTPVTDEAQQTEETTMSVEQILANAKSVDDILASGKPLDEILAEEPSVEEVLAGTASVEDILRSRTKIEPEKTKDEGDKPYIIRPI